MVYIERREVKICMSILAILLSAMNLMAQLSPGDLSKVHSHLEGISNCTQCHVLGNKVSGEKCLVCHTEIQNRIVYQKGYHVSADVRGKPCFSCHSEHNGKNFQLIRLDTAEFNHDLTGYPLSLPHAKKGCRDCHSSLYVSDAKLKAKKNTYLGVNTDCLNCHADYHLKTLSPDCLGCHSPQAFKPAVKFNHSNTKFPLAGKHKNVDCLKCHKVEVINGKKFQEFRGVPFGNCTSCHKDPHNDQFGQNCRQCHNEESFQVVKGVNNFDHNKTDFKLENKHITVSCKKCHKGRFTDPLKHDRCTDCHSDYHNRQFEKNGLSPDCSQCHTVRGFAQFLYTVDQHNKGTFPLSGSHYATPCIECHKKQEKWSFREIGISCRDCHKDIHQNLIQPKYYPEGDCKICHNESRWQNVTFNHKKTGFELSGVHAVQECRTCHFKPDSNGMRQQKFKGLPYNCKDCHNDKHFKQFEKNGVTNCIECHINVPCAKCHKPQQEGNTSYIKYKLKEFKCESCHL